MKLFFGLVDTHQHLFDPNKWKFDSECKIFSRYTTTDLPYENKKYYQNTCLTCGELVEKVFTRN